MNTIKSFNFNLGIPYLLTQWKNFFSTRFLSSDLSAGITVAFIAVPLSLAIALASGVSPGAGLVTAIIAGIVCALFGGTPLAVSGPAAAMSVLIADNVETFGVEGLAVIGLIAGGMQLLCGMFGLGKLGRYVPLPVIAGFTAGIGVIILIGQLPRAFGLQPPAESHAFSVLLHVKQYFSEINISCLLIVVGTIFIIRGLPKIAPRLPSILIAVVTSTLIVYLFNINIPLIGSIPSSLPAPKIPHVSDIPMQDLLFSGFTVFLLASLETLLSSSAIDKITKDKKHDADQELIGQGLGNLAVALFSGIPVTSVIARSVANVRAGAKTRRSSIIHALIILLSVYAIAPIISKIPIAALAGVLFSIAYSMINYHEFKILWRTSRSEGLIYAITFLTIIFVDLIAGVQAGVIAASLIVLIKASKTHLHFSTSAQDDILRLSLTGSLTFLSSGELTKIESQVEKTNKGQIFIMDLSSITNMDSSGAAAVVDIFNQCQERGVKFYIKGLPRRFEGLLLAAGGENIINHFYLVSENELKHKESETMPSSYHGRLVHGVEQFHEESKINDKRLFDFLAQKQDPHTLFIACADSRVVPNLITSTDPGELFIIRNVGNFIPPYSSSNNTSEAAALDFALNNLEIFDIVVCGHANCGAMRACCHDTAPLPDHLKSWINQIKSSLGLDSSLQNLNPNEVAQKNVLFQIESLKTYPVVQRKLANKSLTIHGWFYNFDQQQVFEWDIFENCFKLIGKQKTTIE
jgi:carbonic anhydrase